MTDSSRLLTRPRVLLALVLCLAMAGCRTGVLEYIHNGFKVGPNYARPAAPVADEWIDSESSRFSTQSADYSSWWTIFEDPVLDQLIGMSYSQNLTLREAGFRVLEARAIRGRSVGALFPQQQQAIGGFTRSKRSLQTGGINDAVPLDSFPRYQNLWRFGGQVAWELDFWGRFRRSIEATDARLDASIEEYDDALVILLAEVATTYVDIRTFEQRLEYARNNAELQQESVRVADVKLQQGVENSNLDTPQARANLARTKAGIEELEIFLRQAKNRLAVLLGMPPHDISYLLMQPSPIPAAPESVAVGLPAELLRRRPDVRRAEREAAAQSAEIGIAESDLYPQISITGAISLEADDFDSLFAEEAWAGNIGPEFRWNVLNYRRIMNNIDVQDARFQQLVARYQQTVLQANEEAENAMIGYLRYHDQVELLEAGAEEAREAVRVATERYNAGKIDYNRLFTVQQFLTTQQDQLALAKGNLATSLIALFRAMGGGWQLRLGPVPPADAAPANGPELVPLPMADPGAPPVDAPQN